MRKSLVFLLIICCTAGCSTMGVNNSTNIATDARGYASGQYSDSRYGNIYSPTEARLGGGGGGGGAGGMGLGAVAIGFKSGNVQTEGDPMKFARAVALINASRNLGKISSSDTCGPRENIFTNEPLRQKNYQPFGHQGE